MRIAIAGTQCIGKSTFVKDFVGNWPMYKAPTEKYTDLITKEKKDIKLNQYGNEEGQLAILNFLVDQIMKTKKGDKVIYDRSVLDNLAYTMWLSAFGRVSDEFVKKTIEVVKNALVFYDIIFFCPITKHTPIQLVDAEHRSVDPLYRTEIDNIFKSLMKSYNEHSNTYFPFKHDDGCPALIEIYGNREERIQLAKFYISESGDMFGEGESALADMSEHYADAAELQRALLPKGKGEIGIK
jgi:thymidylate kinase